MTDRLLNKKATIILTYVVLITLIILSAVFMSRIGMQSRIGQKGRNFIRAQGFAREGISCAVQELRNANMQWWTHERIGTTFNMQPNSSSTPVATITGFQIDVNNNYVPNPDDGRLQVRTLEDDDTAGVDDTCIISRGVFEDEEVILAAKVSNIGEIIIWVEAVSLDQIPPIM